LRRMVSGEAIRVICMPRSRPVLSRRSEAGRLKRLRTALGLSQREMATAFNVAHGAVAFWERGDRTISGPVLRLIQICEEELGFAHRSGRPSNQTDVPTSWLSRTLHVSRLTTALGATTTRNGLVRWVSSYERARKARSTTRRALEENFVRSLGELKA